VFEGNHLLGGLDALTLVQVDGVETVRRLNAADAQFELGPFAVPGTVTLLKSLTR